MQSIEVSTTPAAYGRACINCARAKCRCIFRQAGESCERCHRLQKECQPSEIKRKRGSKRLNTSKSARLEAKLDGLVSLLTSASQSSSRLNSENVDSRPPKENACTVVSEHAPTVGFSYSRLIEPMVIEPGVITPERTPTTSSYAPSAISPALDLVDTIPVDESEECIHLFRNQKYLYFPFVRIPPSVSAQQLRQEMPFLWLCIVATTSKSCSRQVELGMSVRQIASQKIVVEYEKSLDLLLGLLVYTAWSNYEIHKKPYLSTLTSLIISLIFDLGLNRPVPKDPTIVSYYTHKGCPKSQRTGARLMEERRAVLGCFVLCSVVAEFTQRTDGLRWTTHMDECLEVLSERRECPEDEILIQQVKMARIIDKIAQLPLTVGHDEDASNTNTSELPIIFYVKALQFDLQDVRGKMTPESQQNNIIQLHSFATELSINEVVLVKPSGPSTNSNLQRLEALYACVNAARSWFDIFLTIPPATYITFPVSIFSQLARALIVLFRLSILDEPGWDTNLVRSQADVLQITTQIADQLKRVAPAIGFEGTQIEGDHFTKASKVMECFRALFESRMGQGVAEATIQAGLSMNTLPDPTFTDLFDDFWITDMLDNWGT